MASPQKTLFIFKTEVIKHPCGCGRITKCLFCFFTKRNRLFPPFLGPFCPDKVGAEFSSEGDWSIFIVSNPSWVFQACQTKLKKPFSHCASPQVPLCISICVMTLRIVNNWNNDLNLTCRLLHFKTGPIKTQRPHLMIPQWAAHQEF